MDFVEFRESCVLKVKNCLKLLDYVYCFINIIYVYLWIKVT
ncbi:hypothetical protein BD780_000566 [Clostridium tetanomorphum]|nr:hypothetical protein [Clostridium tetanomorphum]NRS83341.1 hypothetical protein [Clostridium tetanomorphum]NRZ96541.1 hypothetical protein [Clostridium tetanomorphum]SQC01401.1 Uncharacterised protein [Clostridium tetanomorphum]